MAQSRAEIQKRYREKKKRQEGDVFSVKERIRQRGYRTAAVWLPTSERKKKNEKSKVYCCKYRSKKKERRSTQKNKKETTKITTNKIEISSTADNHLAGDSLQFSSPSTSTRSSCTTSPNEMFVRLNFRRRDNTILGQKRRRTALHAAKREVTKLKFDRDRWQKSAAMYKKRYDRQIPISGESPTNEVATCSTEHSTEDTTHITLENDINSNAVNESENLTPKSKTYSEIREAGLSPRELPKSIVRKLELGNTVCQEIKDAMEQNQQQSKRKVIKQVLNGRAMRKYRCVTLLRQKTGVNLKVNYTGKNVEFTKRYRNMKEQKQLRKTVSSFYERDDVSRCMPGKKDVKKSNDGEKKQTRVLTDYLSTVHAKFLAESPNVKCSLSQFCKLRPDHVKLTNLITRNTCLCTTHQNMALKLKCLRSVGVNVGAHPDVVSKTVNVNQMKTIMSEINVEDVEYEAWQLVECKDGKKRMRIVKCTMKTDEFVIATADQYKLFMEHSERVHQQFKSIAELKTNLPSNEVVVQMDFAENFVCQSADEIQSAYWNSTSVTLHPVVVYRKSDDGMIEHKSYVFVSDVNQHNARAVVAIIQKLVPLIEADFPTTTKLHYWTDSPTSQYRNRYVFDILTRHEDLFGVKAVWNFFESGHGKGPCDGIGGTAKRQAADAVKQGKVSIQDANEFYDWASTHEKSIKYVFYTQDDYDAANDLINERSACAVPGTMKLHAVVPVDSLSLFTRDVSCYCQRCLSGSLCDGWREHRLVRSHQAVAPITGPPGTMFI
ncbi:MAG: hypothetical protein ABW185_27915 [Sedimenticola sp.]